MDGLIAGVRMVRRVVPAAALITSAIAAATAQQADSVPARLDRASTRVVEREIPWPRTIHAGATTLTISQPQVDAWDGFTLAARFAVKASNASRTTYGVVSIDARTLTDRATRTVDFDRAVVTNARFPGASREQAARWASAVANDLTSPGQVIAFDRLETALVASEVEVPRAPQPIDTTPPRIVFSTVPAILIRIDGEPVFRRMPETNLERIVNTRALVLRNGEGVFYLKLFDGWVRSTSLRGAWQRVREPSSDMAAALDFARRTLTVDELSGRDEGDKAGPSLERGIPAIHVATTPTELIVTDGPGNWTPVHGARVFYMLNTTGRVLKSGQDFKVYALIAGRWFRTDNIFGTWSYVSPTALPSDFARIPDASPIENVKASIPGTRQAREAAIASTIAETWPVASTSARAPAPQLDGPARFESIEGTTLEYAVNASAPVIRADGRLFTVDDGVWFTAPSFESRWQLAPTVPAEIDSIPSTSPLYYVTFARVLATAGDTVFVGRFPGYEGTYVQPASHVVVYGTGYHYRSWIGRDWFAAPQTYGFASNLTFTPWTGWTIAFGLGWAWGDAVLANGRAWGVYPWVPRGGARVLDVVSTAPLGASYNSTTGVASAGMRGAINDLHAGTGIVQAREVAVTPTGAIVPARSGAFFRVRPGDRVEFLSESDDRGTREVAGRTRSIIEESSSASMTKTVDATFAGRDGRVYRRSERGWVSYGDDGWKAARTTDALLDEANAMRDVADWRLGMARASGRKRP